MFAITIVFLARDTAEKSVSTGSKCNSYIVILTVYSVLYYNSLVVICTSYMQCLLQLKMPM